VTLDGGSRREVAGQQSQGTAAPQDVEAREEYGNRSYNHPRSRKEKRQIGGFTDQAGSPVSRDQVFVMISESMLANAIAFEEAGVPRQDSSKP
jgi:hypothetical protein